VNSLVLRERVVDVLERAAAGADVEPDLAARLLADLRAVWVRERRWRNSSLPTATVHLAGEVINCREYRRSCPGYIVDRRQTCTRCGEQLVRGRWAVFFTPGGHVAALGTVLYDAAGRPGEAPCTAPGP